jgi:hypothetical protein
MKTPLPTAQNSRLLRLPLKLESSICAAPGPAWVEVWDATLRSRVRRSCLFSRGSRDTSPHSSFRVLADYMWPFILVMRRNLRKVTRKPPVFRARPLEAVCEEILEILQKTAKWRRDIARAHNQKDGMDSGWRGVIADGRDPPSSSVLFCRAPYHAACSAAAAARGEIRTHAQERLNPSGLVDFPGHATSLRLLQRRRRSFLAKAIARPEYGLPTERSPEDLSPYG